MQSKSDRVAALVTGGSGGLGKAIALSLARSGLAVGIGFRSHAEEADEIASKIRAEGASAVPIRIDVTDEASVDGAFGALQEELGGILVLVNNAGLVRPGLFLRYRAEAWDQVLDTNLRGAFLCARRALSQMLRRRWGRIINVSSATALHGHPGMAAYTASKAGLIGLTRALAHEVGSRGITVNAVCPGFLETDMTAEIPEEARRFFIEATPAGRFGRPEEAAAVVSFLASQEASYVNGGVIAVDGGMTS